MRRTSFWRETIIQDKLQQKVNDIGDLKELPGQKAAKKLPYLSANR